MPDKTLSLQHVLSHLERRLDDLANWQITDPDHFDYGALISPEFGMAWGQLAGGFITGVTYRFLGAVALADEQRIAQARTLFPAALLAADAMMRAQRSSGLLDLLSVNYDSSPDTGFTVQQLCTVIELGRMQAQDDAVWVALLGKIEQFIRRAVPGMMDGGFHTPNHRWVIAAALTRPRGSSPTWTYAARWTHTWPRGLTWTPRAFSSSAAWGSTTPSMTARCC